MAKTKATKTKAEPAKTKAAKPAKAEATPGLPAGFEPPLWLNRHPEPIASPGTGDPEIDHALVEIFAGRDTEALFATAERLPVAELARVFDGPALTTGQPFAKEEVRALLSPADKRKQSKAYWAADAAYNQRIRVHAWVAKRLASEPIGRARLLDVAAADHDAHGRAICAQALLPHVRELAHELATRLDPTRWIGRVTNETSTWLGHTYAAGVVGAVFDDIPAAIARFAPLLVPSQDPTAQMHANAVLWGLTSATRDAGLDGAALAGFVPLVVPLVPDMQLGHPAMFLLEYLPHDERIATAACARLGATPDTVAYWDSTCMKLIARSADPRYLLWHAVAIDKSWDMYPIVFRGLAAIGDPAGADIVERWLAAAERHPKAREEAAAVLAALRGSA